MIKRQYIKYNSDGMCVLFRFKSLVTRMNVQKLIKANKNITARLHMTGWLLGQSTYDRRMFLSKASYVKSITISSSCPRLTRFYSTNAFEIVGFHFRILMYIRWMPREWAPRFSISK